MRNLKLYWNLQQTLVKLNLLIKLISRKNCSETTITFLIIPTASAAMIMEILTSWVMRQKGESQNGCFKKKYTKFSEKRTYLCVCVSEGNKCSFSGNLACSVFLKHLF